MNDILNEEKEYNNIYAIPANYTDSGKILGGMLELRNAVETVLIVGAVGYDGYAAPACSCGNDGN